LIHAQALSWANVECDGKCKRVFSSFLFLMHQLTTLITPRDDQVITIRINNLPPYSLISLSETP
jgi:hypothetical protein